jgi:hypothetical protein
MSANKGRRYIQSVQTVTDLAVLEAEGTLAWVDGEKSMYVFANGGWVLFEPVDPASILAIMTYDYDKASNILNIPETYTELNNLVTPARPAGVYEVGLSFTWQFDIANRSALFRWSTDGGVIWNEFQSEPKDVSDKSATYYQYPFVHPGGTMQIATQARKQDANGTFDVTFSDVWFRRVA